MIATNVLWKCRVETAGAARQQAAVKNAAAGALLPTTSPTPLVALTATIPSTAAPPSA